MERHLPCQPGFDRPRGGGDVEHPNDFASVIGVDLGFEIGLSGLSYLV